MEENKKEIKEKERYEVVHQPELVVIKDNETEKMLSIAQSIKLEKEVNKATLEVYKLNEIDKINKKL